MTIWTRRLSRIIKRNPNRHVSNGKFTDTEGQRHSRQLEEFVNSLPDDPNKPGYKANPIPQYSGLVGPVDRSSYKIQNFNVQALKSKQPFVKGKKLLNFDPKKLPEGDMKHPLVVMTRDGHAVVDNGNHRVAHMIATGVKETPARTLTELNGYERRTPTESKE